MLDIIGDIHGHAAKLRALLNKLGYVQKNGSYRHSTRKALFVGDYLDRGPQIRSTMRIVRNMVEHGAATALMGNHEYNALCFHNSSPDRHYLRPHTGRNILQHVHTLFQFRHQWPEFENHLRWMLQLPLWYEDRYLRAVHACWDSRIVSFLTGFLSGNCLNEGNLSQSAQKNHPLYQAVDITLKGREMSLPPGMTFNDPDNQVRQKTRIKWWLRGGEMSWDDLVVHPLPQLPPGQVASLLLSDINFYPPEEKPVFFGHYWLQGRPALCSHNVCCLDFSVARGGVLTAYRYDGEPELDGSKLVSV